MTSLPPITPYHGALGTTQDEFINSILSHHEILKREKRTGYVEMDLVRNLGAYCKGEAQREWQSFMTDHEGGQRKIFT